MTNETAGRQLSKKTNKHEFPFISCEDHSVHPISLSPNFSGNNVEDQIRQEFQNYILHKLEDYSTRKFKSKILLTSVVSITRNLKRDIKSFKKRFNPNIISEEKLHQWINETFSNIDSHLSQLQTLLQSQDDLERRFTSKENFFPINNDNKWSNKQIERAKQILPPHQYDENNDELLIRYKTYVLEKFTSEQIKNNQNPLKNKKNISLDKKYREAETIGKEHLTKLLNDYQRRQFPDLNLMKEMIRIGTERMIKRPKRNELRQTVLSSNLLSKVTFIFKSKQSYRTSLQNIADDFMLLRFGRSLNDDTDSVSDRFVILIHKFLNTMSLLLYLLATNSSQTFSPSSLFSPFDSDLPNDYILSPEIYTDEWTWLLEKWRIALETFPIKLTNEGAFGRLVRTTIGVGVSRLYDVAVNDAEDELDTKFFQSLQMGFYYGIAYALVDGLQDGENHQDNKIDVDQWLEKIERILCGEQFDMSNLPQLPITPLLLETFSGLIHLTSIHSITEQTFTDLALLLRSQRIDKKDLDNDSYNDMDLFVGPILKSHFTYTATAFMGGAKTIDKHNRLWLMPFLGQLTDDCRDFHEDRQAKSITPVTYYAQHNGSTFNPFLLFLFVCEDIYVKSGHDKNTASFLGRRIMRTLRTLGPNLKEFLKIFTERSYPTLYKYTLTLESQFHRINDPEKAIFRHVNTFAKNYCINHRKLETFAFDTLPLIEKHLSIDTTVNNPLVHGMNHSLKAGGKRLRPLLLLMVAQLYNIDVERTIPLAHAIEYLHTSSLIFDDLPAQDNAPLRRGQSTLHMPIGSDHTDDIPQTLTEGRAQLVAVNLIAFAIQLVTTGLRDKNFSCESINRVTVELATSMTELCKGQFFDLQAARTQKKLTIDELDNIAYLKTGKAIEVVLVCPVILAGQDQCLDKIRELGRLMGILFQMKDDLLDVEGETDQLGKLANIDQENKAMTYVEILGVQRTKKRILRKRKQAESILGELWPEAGTIRDVIRYICERRK